MNLSRRSLVVVAALCAMLPVSSVLAKATFPSKPLKIVVPYAPGGSSDYIARILAPSLTAAFGQSVVIENRSGAGGSIGAQAVARSDPDGYTILFHSGTLLIQPRLAQGAGYDPLTDFTPVSILTRAPLVLAVNPSLPVKNVAEFVAYARKNDPVLFYGSAGTGSAQHLALKLFNAMAGTKIKHVPFRGSGPAVAALVAGEIQCMFDIIPTTKLLAQSGKLKVLAVTSKTRSPALPGVPTIDEAGIKNFDFTFWQGMSLPKGVPADVVTAWNNAFKKALSDKEVQARLLEQGYQIVGSTPAELADVMKHDDQTFAKLLADGKLKDD